MSKEKSDSLFILIKSLKKSEKRYFRIMMNNESGSDTPKYIRLFDIIDEQPAFNDDQILKIDPEIKASQLSNLKAHLYKRILQSIRNYHQSQVLDIKIREMIDHAQILFNRSLYDQCADILKKAKKLVQKIDNLELNLEILKWEKKVLTQTLGPGNQKRVDRLIQETEDTNRRITNINTFTNLAARLNSIYYKVGFIKNENEYQEVYRFFNASLPDFDEEQLSLNEKLSLYELFVGYYFFLQDFEQGLHYAQKWVDLFNFNKEIRLSKVDNYLSAINNLMIAQYKLYRYSDFVTTSRQLRQISHLPKNVMNENIRLKLLKYTYVHEFNRFFMLGDFATGVSLINKIKPGLEQFINQLDSHSKVIMYYKMSSLYFGNNDYYEAVVWLNKIINSEKIDIREDIHSFARILNLISHYELKNYDVIEYYIRSTYRYLLRNDNLQTFHRNILNFLRRINFRMTEDELIPEFKKLRNQLLPLQNDPSEKRAFIYFDIISWLESKIEQRPVAQVIRDKAEEILVAKTDVV